MQNWPDRAGWGGQFGPETPSCFFLLLNSAGASATKLGQYPKILVIKKDIRLFK